MPSRDDEVEDAGRLAEQAAGLARAGGDLADASVELAIAVAARVFGRRAIRGLQWGGDRLRMGLVLHMIAGALATTWPASAATIQGAAEANVTAPPSLKTRIALDDERVQELRARGADMDWDQAVAYTVTQTTQALSDLESVAPK